MDKELILLPTTLQEGRTGNVWEWVWDRYGKYSSTSESDPTGPSTGSFRGFRGGGWYYVTSIARVSYRNLTNPSYGDNYQGFRLTRTIR